MIRQLLNIGIHQSHLDSGLLGFQKRGLIIRIVDTLYKQGVGVGGNFLTDEVGHLLYVVVHGRDPHLQINVVQRCLLLHPFCHIAPIGLILMGQNSRKPPRGFSRGVVFFGYGNTAAAQQNPQCQKQGQANLFCHIEQLLTRPL